MQINPLMFRAYDIRGIAGKDLTPDSVYAIGKAFGSYMREKYGKKLVCGRDNRLHSEELQQAYISGLLASGCHVTNVGLATSPMIYYATCKYDFDGGTNITASHNPKEYNGAKLVAKNAHSVCGDEIKNLLLKIENDDFLEGKGEYADKEIFPDYLADIKSRVQISKPLKVVTDAGNGVAGKFAPALLRELGCEVVELYCELDGNFPHHEANPEEEKNVADLKKTVVEQKADIGIAFDGDGDRVGVIDETGKHYHADFLLIPLSRDLLTRHPGAKIIFDVKSSRVVEEDIRKHGGIPIRYKTGHSFIEAKLKQEKALLAGETSGHLFFAENYFGFDDALFAAAKILEVLAKSRGPFSAFYRDVPKMLTTPEIKIPCSDEGKFDVVEDVKQYFQKRYPCITIDGVWVDFGDSSWGACRPSNTGPHLTLRFEAKNQQKLDLIQKIIFDKLREYPEVELPRPA